LTYTINFENVGPSDAQSVIITDTLPSGVEFGGLVQVDTPFSFIGETNGKLIWHADILEKDISGDVLFTVTVNPDQVGILENVVEIQSETWDDDLENNQMTASTVIGSPDFATIYGTVYDDIDGDGTRNPGEPGIPNVLISLDEAYTTTTNDNGIYYFLTDLPGNHSILEKDPPDYLSTTPNQVHITVTMGSGYQVDFGDMVACTCGPDGYEDDDTVADSKLIPVGIDYIQQHDFCDDSVDWLKFTAQAGKVYNITTLASGVRADTVLTLYDTDGVSILVANDDQEESTDFSSRIVWEAPADGLYFIRVNNRSDLSCCNTEYSIWVDEYEQDTYQILLPLMFNSFSGIHSVGNEIVTPAGIINHICPDNYEVDDTWEFASEEIHEIKKGIVQSHSFDSNPALFAADKDLVWFQVESGETVRFIIEQTRNTGTLLELFDEDGSALNITGTEALSWTPQNSGRYYLSISPMDQTVFGCADVSGYDLRMELETPTGYWVYLPNIHR
jgi:hypothetical protein